MKAHARDKSTFTISNLVVDISVNWSLGFPHRGEPLLHNPLLRVWAGHCKHGAMQSSDQVILHGKGGFRIH